MPEDWLVSRVCEEFHLTPAKAVREIENDDGLLFRVIDLRTLKRAKDSYDAATPEQRAKFTSGSPEDLIAEFTFTLARERLQGKT